MIRSELDEAFELYEKIRKRAQNDGLATFLFQELWRNQRTRMVQQNRSARHEGEVTEPHAAASRVDYATVKQIKLLEDLGVRIPYNLSKQHASRMLDERLGKADEPPA